MDDLLSSPAYLFIAEQVASGAISPATGDAYKNKFAEIHRLVHSALEREKDDAARARELKSRVRDEQIACEKAKLRREQLEALHEQAALDNAKLKSELTKLAAREEAAEKDTAALRAKEKELLDDVARLGRDNEAMVTPALAALVTEIADAKAEHARATAAAEYLITTKAQMTTRIAELDSMVHAARSTGNALRIESDRAAAAPGRTLEAAEKVVDTIEALQEEIARLKSAVASSDKELEAQMSAMTVVRSTRLGADQKLKKHRREIELREQEVDEIERTLRSERTQHKDLLERRVDMQADAANASNSLLSAEHERDAASAGYERAKRELRRKLDAANAARAEIPTIESVIGERKLQHAALVAEAADFEATATATKKEAEVLMQAFLKAEGVEKKQKAALLEIIESCKALEEDKERWHREEMLAHKQIAALKAQREIKGRELSKVVASRKATVEVSKIKELHLLDLSKQLAEINTRLRQFAAMYEVVKSERNSFANSIQSASQSIAEMRERIKILKNEVDILQNESLAKDKALAKEKQAHTVAAVQRDALRSEANKCAVTYKEKQALVENQIMSIDKLNGIITKLEREMLSLKRHYESAVETRNFSGIQLIDRNDELCILYEKSNIHERTLGEGEKALRVVVEEIRALKLSIGELERNLHMARSKVSDTPALAERILELQKQLTISRQRTEKLCLELESPALSSRWVELGGDDPEPEELQARVTGLERRVAAAREELLEKEMVHEEVSSLTEKLRATVTAATTGPAGVAASGGAGVSASVTSVGTALAGKAADAPGLALAKTSNELQAKIKETNRRMMAVVSELSMYQATALKLAAEAAQAQDALKRAQDADARGLPPTPAAEHKWQSIERARLLPGGASAGAAGAAAAADGALKTTAEARPNAYIPEGIGLPKPYGEFAPFKPQEPGAIMRFFRNPEPKEIEL